MDIRNYNIQLIDIKDSLVDAWSYYFANYENVKIFSGSIFNCATDCIVSPANSFGFMDGGLDGVITKNLGSQVQKAVQSKIDKKFNGELLVGQSLLVKTNNASIPYLISAPTMRIPSDISDSVNVYLASRAIFNLLKKLPVSYSQKIQTISIPGLGTGVGKVTGEQCAKQMKLAYESVINGINFNSLSDAFNYHHNILK